MNVSVIRASTLGNALITSTCSPATAPMERPASSVKQVSVETTQDSHPYNATCNNLIEYYYYGPL